MVLYFKDLTFLESGMEREREGEKHQCVVASYVPPTGDLAHNPGMCPTLETEPTTLSSQASTQSIEPHQPGQLFFISITESFMSDWIFFHGAEVLTKSLSILVTGVLNSAPERLLISISFSSFSRVLICSFIWVTFVSTFWQPPCVCFYVIR